MKFKTHLALIVCLIKSIALLYINFTTELGLIIHLVIIPVLLLESLAMAGFFVEFSVQPESANRVKLSISSSNDYS